MQFDDAIKQLENDKSYAEWKKKNPSDFLAHGFWLNDDLNKDAWQIGYYNKKKDSITTFFVVDDDVKKSQESEVFKRPDAVIEPLDAKAIKISSEKAMEIARKLQKQKYAADPVQKSFMIVQTLDKKTVFNITLLTATLKTINIRVDAKSGTVVLEKVTPLMSFTVE